MTTLTVPRRMLVAMLAAVALLPLVVLAPVAQAAIQTVGLLLIPGICAISFSRTHLRGPVLLLAVVVALSVAAHLLVIGAIDVVSLWLGWRSTLEPSSLQVELSLFWFLLAVAVHLFGHDMAVQMPRRPGTGDLIVLCCAGSALVQAQAGALILNNGGSGRFALVSYGFVAACFVSMILLPTRPTRDTTHLVLVWLAVALLWSNSLRSPYLSGVDINYEYQIATMVQAHGVWDPASLRDAFMACLSSSLFPVVFSNIAGIPMMVVFKVAMPLLFSLIAVFVFEIGSVFVGDRGAIAAVFFFLAQPGFQQWLSIPVRQEVALLLFAVSLWALLTRGLDRSSRITFFWISSVGMLFSHYSTVYVACFIFFVALGFEFVLGRLRRRVIRQERRVLNVVGVVALSAGAVIWYGPATTHTYAVAEFASHSTAGLRHIFDPSVQQPGQSAFKGFGLFTAEPQQNLVSTYVRETTRDYRARYGSAALLGPPSSAANVGATLLAGGQGREPWASLLPPLRSLAKILGLLVLSVGVVRVWRTWGHADMARVLVGGAFLTGVVLVLLPFVSISYDLMRLYQQLLVLLAPMVVIGAATIFRRSSQHKPLIGSTLLVVYFALLSRATFQLGGGSDVSMTFSNRGWDYSIYYVAPQDVSAAAWLATQWRNDANRPLVFADSVAASKLRLVAPVALSAKVKPDLLPATYVRGSYMYLDRTNLTLGGTVIRDWRGRTLSMTVNRRYFDEHLNRVYSTSSSAVYH